MKWRIATAGDIMLELLLKVFVTVALAQSIEGGGAPAVTPGVIAIQSASYTGPGDVVSGASMWWGLRAYTAAIAAAHTQKVVNIARASDSHACDVIIATNGGLGLTANCGTGGDNGQSATSFCNATTCSVTALYDQTVGNDCTSASCDLLQATAADQPTLAFTGCTSGSLPCIQCNGTTDLMTSANPIPVSTAQPFTYSAVSVANVATSTQTVIGVQNGNNSNGPEMLWDNGSTNVFTLYNGSSGFASATQGNWYAAQGLFNGASSVLYLNGTSNSVNPNTGGFGNNGNQAPQLCKDQFGNIGNVNIAEVGIWLTTSFNGTQNSSMNSNQRSYWGF